MLISNEIEFFRIAVAIAIAGLSIFFFILPGLVRLNSEYFFSILNRFIVGITFGMSLIEMPSQALFNLRGHNIVLTTSVIQACSFLAMIIFEQFSAVGAEAFLSSYSYSAVNLVEDGDGTEMTSISDQDLSEIEDLNPNGEQINTTKDLKSKLKQNFRDKKRFFPSAVLIITCLYGLCYGFVVASHQHENYGTLIGLILNSCVIALSLGTTLEFLCAPKTYFFLFLGLFCLSSPVGIVCASLITLDFKESAQLQLINSYMISICSGVYLYLATMHILPAELLYSNQTGACCTNVMKSIIMMCGFLIIVLPAEYTSYE